MNRSHIFYVVLHTSDQSTYLQLNENDEIGLGYVELYWAKSQAAANNKCHQNSEKFTMNR